MNNQTNVYINKVTNFLPNEPISNDDMEIVLGKINDQNSKARRIVLRNNGIEQRYYAIDRLGNITHTNALLTKEAINKLFDENFTNTDVELLSCGTSTPDQMLPSHAAMVHGLMANKNIEINSSAGICSAGMSSLKFGFLSVKSGNTSNAICTGSEKTSTWMIADKFNQEIKNLEQLEEQPIIAFKKDFLRWMLSDGAGAMLLQNKPNEQGISLRLDWMEGYSYAHEIETCMYAGGDKNEDGSLKPWSDYKPEEWLEKSIFSIKQDVKLLDVHIIEKGVDSLKSAIEKNNLKSENIDYFLPHISSYYFAEKLRIGLKEKGLSIPDESWFMNLKTVGNVGAASIYLMLEELMYSGKLKKGQQILLSVPESGRFSYAYAKLTVC